VHHELLAGIFSIKDEASFRKSVLEVFRLQSRNNPVYREYILSLNRDPEDVREPCDIPFLPVELFKSHKVLWQGLPHQQVFESSGTGTGIRSRHYLADTGLYEKSFLSAFRHFYGDPRRYCILALLPSYPERKNSSLAFMADGLIRASHHPASGFFLDDAGRLLETIHTCEESATPCILLGVSYALLELAGQHPLHLDHTIVMETGGMKGMREELTREAMHATLKEKWGLAEVHSEYGMCELLTQAYSKGRGIFHCPPWMSVMVRDIYDPFTFLPAGMSGALNIIDLANLYSCSFIESKDLGELLPGGGFTVMGRLDDSETRGCNLLLSG
jgi:phenylacetate-coenzyme A ligase PaaK-like adenylate-forming protein